MDWALTQPLIRDLILHVANEGKRANGYLLKRMGLRKGVSDFFIPLPRNGYHGLWIELKPMKGGKLSKEQKEWLDRMKSLGYAAYVAQGWVNASLLITQYLA